MKTITNQSKNIWVVRENFICDKISVEAGNHSNFLFESE